MVNLGPATAQRMQRQASQTEPDAELESGEDDSNPFKSKDWRVWSYTWSGFAVRILIIVGGIFSVLQYLDTREENRVERTLQLVELWEEPEFQEAQKAIGARLDALNAQFGELLDRNATPEERAVYFDRIGAAAMQADGGTMPVEEFRAHFDRMLYFLNRMAFCTEGNLCSKDVVDGYFGDFAKSFWAYFGGYIEEQRSDVALNYGAPLERYVESLTK
jgi:hypothetical protein